MKAARSIRTTVGELIVTITDAALEVSRDERKAYRLTGIVLNRMAQAAPAGTGRQGIKLPRKLRVH
jgi:hypothetical protein